MSEKETEEDRCIECGRTWGDQDRELERLKVAHWKLSREFTAMRDDYLTQILAKNDALSELSALKDAVRWLGTIEDMRELRDALNWWLDDDEVGEQQRQYAQTLLNVLEGK